LEQFSKTNPTELKIMLLDNGAFHKAERLVISENIILLFIPPYSPELNPSGKIWWKIKRAFSGKLHQTLDNVSQFISNQIVKLTKKEVMSICGFEYLFSCDYWAKIY
jgi:transposase